MLAPCLYEQCDGPDGFVEAFHSHFIATPLGSARRSKLFGLVISQTNLVSTARDGQAKMKSDESSLLSDDELEFRLDEEVARLIA
jgi:hypothetical protein